MPHITLILCTTLSIAIAYWVVLKPLFLTPVSNYFDDQNREADFSESISLLESISELEVDFKMGKISQEDYEGLLLEYQRNYLATQEKQ